MSKIKFTMQFDRIATIRTTKGHTPVGKVEEFKQNPHGSIDLVIALDVSIHPDIRKAIEKNPGQIGIMSTAKPVDDAIILE